jgi:hypothetical protein
VLFRLWATPIKVSDGQFLYRLLDAHGPPRDAHMTIACEIQGRARTPLSRTLQLTAEQRLY